MVSAKILPAFLSLFALASAQLENNVIEYNVINLLNDTHTMGVIVDNVTYPLSFDSKVTNILYNGKAPVAKNGYQYAKISKEDNSTEAEPFVRQPTHESTLNEFYNRTWNTQNVSQLPVVFEPLKAINRAQSDLHREGEIPTIHLVANQTAIDLMHNSNSTEDYKIDTNMTYITLNNTQSYEAAEISLAGRSSRWMTKLSYNIKLAKKDRIGEFRRVKLRAMDTDPSYIREQLAYDVIKSTGLLSSEFSFVRVFLNNQALGLFGIIETFHDPWLANSFAGGDKKYKNGNLYQGVFQNAQSSAMNRTSDLSYYNNITAYADGQYKIKVEASKGKSEDYTPLMEFTKFIDTAPTTSSDAVAAWNEKLDTDSFLRSMALEVIMGYSDGYFTMVDNYYLYQNLDTGKFFYISSDMDLTLGSCMFKLDDMWSGNYTTFPGLATRPLMKKILQVPEFKQQYEELLVNITQKLVNPVVMNDRINGLVAMTKEDVAWDKTLPRVGKDVFGALGAAMSNSSDMSSMESSDIGNVIGDFPPNMDMEVLLDFGTRMSTNLTQQDAVNGPTGYKSLSGVKEWIKNQSGAITKFYNSTS
ncbi:coth protein-domain-containing protein [Mucor mucedo]|uniref:coth protein-domain-containing protein n=1 Tax=Mucor mucedo TaxID=29922 RepID=UPI0022204EC2|nr:coth protein-domain-containing protein [Mucor mucedo]KAI7895222.1 coth protein-domain-containing protein [Mucor mucedo]